MNNKSAKGKQAQILNIEYTSPPEDRESLSVMEYLTLDQIRRDGGTQPRTVINWKHVKLLEEQMEEDFRLEPITVFYDGQSYWLADGFHRWHAHHNRESEVISCVIHQGSRRDAVLYSVGANADNKPALPRSRQDKRRAIMTLLQDPHWSQWSDREIARQCKVSDRTVNRLRLSICDNDADTKLHNTRKVLRNGKTYTVDTTNIGKKVPTSPKQQPFKQLELAHHLKLIQGGLIEIHAPNNNKIHHRLGRIAAVHHSTVDVWVRDVSTMTIYKYTLQHQQIEPVPLENQPEFVQVCNRISKLRNYHLDPFELEILNLLERTVVLTPTEFKYLTMIEKNHYSRDFQ